MTLTTSITFILLSVILAVCSQTVTESEPVIKRPGDSHKLTCTYAGISDGDADISWIRQAEGKGLEWVAHISAPSGSNKYYSTSVQNRFTISRDNNVDQVYLHMSSLTTEDSAIYYCARTLGEDYFDYWGKGTTVTVTTATSTAPTVFPLVPCGSESGDMVTLGCLATGFNPPAVTFSWTKDSTALTDFIQYPAVQKGNVYTGVSQVRVSREDWDTRQNFQCAVRHAAGNAQTPMVFKQDPTLKVLSSFIEDGTYTVSCFAKEFAPKQHDIKWLKNGAGITSKIELISTVSEPIKADGKKVYNAASFLTVNSSEVTEDTIFTCVFTGGQNASLSKTDRENTQAVSTKDPTVAVHILPQLHTDQLNPQDEITLVCLVTSAVNKMYKIEWSELFGTKRYFTGTNVPVQQSKNDKKWQSMSLYTTSKQNWDKQNPTKMFTCHVKYEGIHLRKSVSRPIDEFYDLRWGNIIAEEDSDFSSLWSTASSFIFLFIFSLFYSITISLLKIKRS